MNRSAIDPELPWGVWLRIEPVDRNPRFVDDATGEVWPSLRAAFWNGRLGMPNYNREPPEPLLELVHAVLARAARRNIQDREETNDLFAGSEVFRNMFHLWLGATGLVLLDSDGHPAHQLTDEGWSVLAMLSATRPYDVRSRRPCGATVRELIELGLGPEDREARLARVERTAANWDHAFLRRIEAGRPAIVLSSRGTGPVPTLLTVWSLTFKTDEQRDSFYDWLCRRLDRWPAWAKLTSEYSSRELTHKLLQILVASFPSEDSDATPLRDGSGPKR